MDKATSQAEVQKQNNIKSNGLTTQTCPKYEKKTVEDTSRPRGQRTRRSHRLTTDLPKKINHVIKQNPALSLRKLPTFLHPNQ